MVLKNKFFMILFVILVSTVSCKKGCTDPNALNYDNTMKKDDGTCMYSSTYNVSFSFLHTFSGVNITSTDLNSLNFMNENGELLSLTRLRYSISNIGFYLSSGDSVMIDEHHLIDIEDASSLNYVLPQKIEENSYIAISFNLGFEDAENISGAYSDLNLANWSWPESLGGGYHQMQMEGRFINTISDTVSYQYHMGSSAREIVGIDTTFHPNSIHVKLPISSFILENDATIELKMDLAEWFKNPNTWDLNLLSTSLMPNYSAQVLMNQNGASVFSLGNIIQ